MVSVQFLERVEESLGHKKLIRTQCDAIGVIAFPRQISGAKSSILIDRELHYLGDSFIVILACKYEKNSLILMT